MDGADPSGVRYGPPLSVGDRDHRDRGKCREDHLMLRQVKPAMERSDKGYGLTGKQGERIVIEMEVQQIKIVSPLANSLECNAFGSRTEPSRRNAFGQHASSWAEDSESPLANKTTSCPSATSSSVSHEMTRSVPP